ncbi:MAG: lysophospholipase [Thermoflexibacter sp.]|nr:lysophospholipase [Thermoflexibacter sp.]
MKTTFLIIFLGFILQTYAFSQSKEETVSVNKIEGTLLTPEPKKTVPVVLIIAGSGPTDRNGNSIAGVTAQPYKLLAEEFAKNEIATLRYDKRGVAKSVTAGMKEDSLRFEHYIDDAVAWVNFLSKDKRFSSVTILGHSEGSLIGMVAAQKSKTSKFISLAGAGRPINEVILQQLKDQKQPENIITDIENLFNQLKEGKLIENPNPMYMSLFRPSVQPYMISWLRYNPQLEIKKLQIPTLIVQGTTDIQVAESEALLLKEASPKAKYLLVEKMNHILKASTADRAENIATYSKPDLPLAEGLMSGLVEFVKK